MNYSHLEVKDTEEQYILLEQEKKAKPGTFVIIAPLTSSVKSPCQYNVICPQLVTRTNLNMNLRRFSKILYN